MDKDKKSNLICYLPLLLLAIPVLVCGAVLWATTQVVLFVGIMLIVIYGILDLIELFKE